MAGSNRLPETASQTAGPYVHIGLATQVAGLARHPAALGADIAGPNAAGERIRVEGCVHDGAGAPVTDAVIDIWQANADGVFAHPADPRAGEIEPGFRGWGRACSDFGTGEWAFETVKPGAAGDGAAPHISLWIVARGVNLGLATRLYFADEPDANSRDTALNQIVPADRRRTLIASPLEQSGRVVYRFDIRLQGEDETVFFDI